MFIKTVNIANCNRKEKQTPSNLYCRWTFFKGVIGNRISKRNGRLNNILNKYLCSALQLLAGVGHRLGQWLHPALSLLPLRSQLGQSIAGGRAARALRPFATSPYSSSRITRVTIAHASLVHRSSLVVCTVGLNKSTIAHVD